MLNCKSYLEWRRHRFYLVCRYMYPILIEIAHSSIEIIHETDALEQHIVIPAGYNRG